MFKKIYIFSLLVFCFSCLLSFGAQAQVISGDPLIGLDQTADEVTAFQNKTPDINFVQTSAGKMIGTVLSFVGVLFLIMMIFAGISWMTAAGNDQRVSKAKDLLVNSIIGIVIVFAAYAITAFVGNFVTNQFVQ